MVQVIQGKEERKGSPMDEEFVSKIQIGPEGSSLDLLRAVYRSPYVSLHVRMRAATAALQFEHPKLSAQASWHADGSFAERLDAMLEKAMVRSDSVRQVRTIKHGRDGNAKLIDHEPAKVEAAEGSAGSPARPVGVRRL